MNAKAPILPLILALALALAATPASNAGHPGTACVQQQFVHAYVATTGASAGSNLEPLGSSGSGVALAVVQDTCDQGAVDGGDGDPDLGLAGGGFPAGTNANGCSQPPEVPHHSFGPGAQYWASDDVGGPIAYAAGADGPALVQDPTDPAPCATDGAISGDPMTDPLDCGAGQTGYYWPSVVWTPATLGENVPGNGACDPYNAFVWAFIATGPQVQGPGGSFVSTPTSGHIHN